MTSSINLAALSNGLAATMNPTRVSGIFEAITAWLLIVGVLTLLFLRIDVPAWLQLIFGMAVGAYLGAKSENNKKSR